MGGTGVAVQIYDSDGKLKLAIHLASNRNWVTIRCSGHTVRCPLQHSLKLNSNINVMINLVQIDNNSSLHAYSVLAVCSPAMRCKVTLLLPAASFTLHVKGRCTEARQFFGI